MYWPCHNMLFNHADVRHIACNVAERDSGYITESSGLVGVIFGAVGTSATFGKV